ncbi:MAG TPA: SDR family NAD(P)-dependent oxidoreductase [Polyangiales bacterium]|nr:SDR family NAD(P)-dependent oxidoreductase [Polyangiales bacterium]
MANELKGRTAVVTGASRGIGVHIAGELAKHGVRLALVARSGAELRSLAEQINRTHATNVVVLQADLAQLTHLGTVVERALAELGAIDILVNNAGIDGIRVYAEESPDQTEAMIRTNLLSPMLLTRACLPHMLARGRGHIVNVASLAGKSAAPYCVSYGAAKAGLAAFTHALRTELSGTGVSASVVCPGFVRDVGMFANVAVKHDARVSPLLGTATPEQVARAVVDALRDDVVEITVNPGPIRLMAALNQLAPSMVSWVQRRVLGVDDMLRGIALAERNQSPADTSTTRKAG